MGPSPAKQGDQIVTTDTHGVLAPVPSESPVHTPLPHLLTGIIRKSLSCNVNTMSIPAGIVFSAADTSLRFSIQPGTVFVKPPSNNATITLGCSSVFHNNMPPARHGDAALTCYDLVDLYIETEIVFVGG